VLDFTSALYLGLRHGSGTLGRWDALTLGKPAALGAPPVAGGVAEGLAALQGLEATTVGPSTLHLFWDLLGLLARDPVAILMDQGTYPIARWGVERAAARGVPVRIFRHHDLDGLREALQRLKGRCLVPVVIADGFCPGCGKPAPLSGYAEAAASSGGFLVIDDTQALGILGARPTAKRPYGRGGGGSVRFAGLRLRNVAVIASLAKGFGVPMAALSGTRTFVRRFEGLSDTRVHCSPPSIPVLEAARTALEWNRRHGESRRAALLSGIQAFRNLVLQAGWTLDGNTFPVQTLAQIPGANAAALHARLSRSGVRTVLHGAEGRRAAVAFIVTARHSPEEIERAALALGSPPLPAAAAPIEPRGGTYVPNP